MLFLVPPCGTHCRRLCVTHHWHWLSFVHSKTVLFCRAYETLPLRLCDGLCCTDCCTNVKSCACLPTYLVEKSENGFDIKPFPIPSFAICFDFCIIPTGLGLFPFLFLLHGGVRGWAEGKVSLWHAVRYFLNYINTHHVSLLLGVNRVTYWSQGVASLPHKCQPSLPSTRKHPSYDCLAVKREYYQNCSVLGCVTRCSQSAAHSYEQFLQVQQIGFVTLGPLRHA